MFHCPQCRSIIYSPRSKRCGVCEAELPEHLHLDDEQRQKIETQMKESEHKHRETLAHIGRVVRLGR
jgi:coenzyme F420-reducing hydrogenase beta subunit